MTKIAMIAMRENSGNARATAFATDLVQLSETGDWRRSKAKRKTAAGLSITALVGAALAPVVWRDRSDPSNVRVAARRSPNTRVERGGTAEGGPFQNPPNLRKGVAMAREAEQNDFSPAP